MKQTNQPLHLEFNSDRTYIAIVYEDQEVGFCTPEIAARIVETLNEDEQLHEDNDTLTKALQMACLDLIRRTGGNPARVNKLMERYLENAKRPEHGTRAIAFLLRDRQRELDVSDKEFIFFCNSYRLSPQELRDIYRGKDITDEQIKVIARIVGKSAQELIEIRDGFSNNEMNTLARILGTSTQELTELLK
ncbi:hypothetical protein K4A83_07670 [Spirulina subsalsa FACHB-351]|uniref:Uncharacterized protein n=1 Tax=Spirulina subsalsa FACHB-351 TaxID=234711 RepID=A0ABT3L3S2_9CYAN|nr:hypothetical protein [Spirulina subsalsa]MCW6036149.1 hypothetical protein [Spirulina subsalsa FACHB-351]